MGDNEMPPHYIHEIKTIGYDVTGVNEFHTRASSIRKKRFIRCLYHYFRPLKKAPFLAGATQYRPYGTASVSNSFINWATKVIFHKVVRFTLTTFLADDLEIRTTKLNARLAIHTTKGWFI